MARMRNSRTDQAAGDGSEDRMAGGFASISQIAIYAALLVAWQVLLPLSGVPAFVVPTPLDVASALVRGFTTGSYLSDLGVTLFEMLSGFLIAALGGILTGALIVEIRIIERVFYPLIVAVQSLPKIALAPLMLMWIGFGLSSKVAMAALVAFFPVLVNTIAGLRASDRDMNQLFRSLRASRLQALWYLKLPAATPFIIAGLDVAFVFALLGAIVGEFVGAASGLGYAILQLQFQLDTPGVFAILVILALIGLAGHAGIRALGRRVAFWQSPDAAGQ
jgi:NitT/TauT family transport system permease protein